MRACLLVVLACAWAPGNAASDVPATSPVPAYRLEARIALGEGKRCDYLTLDDTARRLYLARADRVEIIDLQTGARVGHVGGLTGTHGVAVATGFGRAYISDGKANAVVVFDPATLAILRTVAVGRNPDAIVFDARTRRIAVFNGASHDASILDAATGELLQFSIPLGGKPEFARADGSGHVLVNIEDTAEVVDLDLGRMLVQRRYSIAPCADPTGLALDPRGRAYSVCANHLMVISDPATGAVLGSAAIGARPDGVVFDQGLAYSANGGDGTISIVGETSPGVFALQGTVTSQAGARTLAVDPRSHSLYLPSPTAAGSTSGNELEILVFARP